MCAVLRGVKCAITNGKCAVLTQVITNILYIVTYQVLTNIL